MRARGYTLIEIVVVVAIVAIVAGTALLAIGAFAGTRTVEREGNRVRELVRAACDRAVSSGRDYGVHLANGGYGFSVAGYRQWTLESAGDLRPRELPEGVALAASREGRPLELGRDQPAEPQLVCYASGELTPFELRVELDRDTGYVVTGELDGKLDAHADEDQGR